MPEKIKKLPKTIRRRLELAGLFDTPAQNDKRKWGRLFTSDFKCIKSRFEVLAGDKGYKQKVVSGDTILWYDTKKSHADCMIYFVQDVMDLDRVETIFRRIKEYNPFFTYAIVPQFKDGEGVFDIFRFSRFSFLEHHNRVRAPRKK